MGFTTNYLADWAAIFAALSALFSCLAYAPYIRDTICGYTRPQRASWLIWSILGSIAFFSQAYEGATASLWFAGAQVGGTITVFLLSILRGQGVFLSRPDERVLWLAAIGLVIWYFTETAVYALALTITISLLGGTLTVIKAFRAPESETASTWLLSFVASAAAIAAIGAWEPVLLAYPLYLFTLNAAIVIAMTLGKARQARARAPVSVSVSAFEN